MTQPRPIGICIYCGRDDIELTDEHIVPYGFGNTMGDILYKASCKSCAKITSSFEETMLRDNFLPIRSVLQMRSRKKKTYKTMPQTVRYTDGTIEEIDVPYDKFLGQFALPVFEQPSYFQGNYAVRLLTFSIPPEQFPTFTIGSLANKTWYEEQNIDAHYIHYIKSNKGQAYARFILKIAYCAAVKYEGINAVKDSPVRDLILGKDDHFAVYFGNLSDNQFKENPSPDTIIRYAVASLENSTKKLVAVQFFPFLNGSPIYHTVV